MEEKKIISVGKMTLKLVIFYIIAEFIIKIGLSDITEDFSNKFSSSIIQYLVTLIFLGIIVFISWHLSIATAFKKHTINVDELKKLMRNLFVFTGILCLILVGSTFKEVLYELEDTTENLEDGIQTCEVLIEQLNKFDNFTEEDINREKAKILNQFNSNKELEELEQMEKEVKRQKEEALKENKDYKIERIEQTEKRINEQKIELLNKIEEEKKTALERFEKTIKDSSVNKEKLLADIEKYENEINQMRTVTFATYGITQLGIILVYLVILMYEKKYILKKMYEF